MGDVATARNAPAASTNRLLLLLSLLLSPASRVIGKQGGGRRLGVDDGAFRCRTCGRSFATFQALGGHRTSHNRPRVRANGLDLLLGARPGKGGGTAREEAHRCNACGTVFPTGQALGGHMRRHRAAAAALDVAALEAIPPPTVSRLSEEGDEENYYTSHLSSTLIQFI